MMQLKIPSEKDIREAYRKGEDSVVEVFHEVLSCIKDLSRHIEKQQQVIEELQRQIAKNSSNSSKPPSSDGFKKHRTSSLRKKGEKTTGGQEGHKGSTLNQVETPDHKVVYETVSCVHCQTSLSDVPVSEYENRQVFDIPAIHIEVTAHKAEVKFCPQCGKMNKGVFPQEVSQPVQYGDNVKSHAVYFNNYHHIPVARTAEIFEDVFGHRISEGVILQSNDAAATAVAPSTETIKEQLINSDVVHFDESGLKVKGKLHWLHVASNDRLTYYGVHGKRGQNAMDDIAILPDFQGTAVHDHWKSYFAYNDCEHSLCNAHHLRELKFINEHHGQTWAKEMSDLLIEIKEEVHSTKAHSDHLDSSKLSAFEARYDKIVEDGLKANPPPPPENQPTKKGKVKQSPPKNLLDRLKSHKKNVLLFMHDFRVPFDNNQGERDVRMIKVKQKVSGTFRSDDGADAFCRIRGYISTVRKHSRNVIDAIQSAFKGMPFIPLGSH